MIYTYKTTGGVCSKSITLEIENGILKNVQFEGGCPGNAGGISTLVRGMTAEQVADQLKDVKCGARESSCPAQLACAIREAMEHAES